MDLAKAYKLTKEANKGRKKDLQYESFILVHYEIHPSLRRTFQKRFSCLNCDSFRLQAKRIMSANGKMHILCIHPIILHKIMIIACLAMLKTMWSNFLSPNMFGLLLTYEQLILNFDRQNIYLLLSKLVKLNQMCIICK